MRDKVDACALAQKLAREWKEAEKEAAGLIKLSKKLRESARELDSAYHINRAKIDKMKRMESMQDIIRDKPLRTRMTEALSEVYTSSLISGFTTHAINIGSSGLYSILMPIQKAAGHTLTGQWKDAAADGAQLVSLMENAAISMQWMLKSVRHDRNFIDTGVHIMDQAGPIHAMSSKSLGIKNKIGARVVDAVGTGYRAVGHRLIGAGDELITQLNYRAKLHAVLTKDLMDKGMPLHKAYTEARAGVKKNMEKLLAKEGEDFLAKAKLWGDEEAIPEIVDYTREMTFKQRLNPEESAIQATGAKISQWMEHVPAARILLFPFVRTPTWLFETGLRNTFLLNGLSKPLRRDLSGAAGEEARAKAIGQLATSVAVAGTAFYAALNGKIIGNQGSDWKVERNAKEAGKLPYSFVYTDKEGKERYIQYNYLDPVAMPVGIMADAVQAYNNQDIESFHDLLSLAVANVTNYLGSKAYFQGLTNFMKVMNDDDPVEAFRKWSLSPVSALVPNMVNQMSLDDRAREARSAADKILSRIPRLQEDLPVKRDSLGQPLSKLDGWAGPAPLKNSIATDSPVYEEMARLALKRDKPFMPLSWWRAGNAIDLRDEKNKKGLTFYDELARRVGEVPYRGGRNLHDNLKKLISSPRYKRSNDGEPGYPSPRAQMIKDEQRRAIEYHERKMLKLPEWRETYKRLKNETIKRRRN